MGVFFARSYEVIRRNPGQYVDGVWTPAFDAQAIELPMNIQPASENDYIRVQAVASGRRVTAMMRAFTNLDAELKVAGDNHPGDIVLYNGQRWLVIGSARRDVLGDAESSHMRFMLALEAEHAAGEVMA